MLAETMREEKKRWWGQCLDLGLGMGSEKGRDEDRLLVCLQAGRKFGADTEEHLGDVLAGVSDPARLAQVAAWTIECETANDLMARVLDTREGCTAEEVRHYAAERIRNVLAEEMSIGWCIHLMVTWSHGGSEVSRGSELIPRMLLSEDQLRVLGQHARHYKLPPPENLAAAIALIGHIGGWRGREGDPPGARSLWSGCTRLVAATSPVELKDERGWANRSEGDDLVDMNPDEPDETLAHGAAP